MGCGGKTTAMPGQRLGGFPAIRSFPVVERHGFIWVWPGDAAQADTFLLLAGGIGSTPILCVAERLAPIGAAFELHHCTRSLERTAFVERILQSSFAAQTHWQVDDGDAAQRLDLAALLGTSQQPRHAGVHLYVCGPRGFMDAVLGAARAAGWPEAQLHSEFFLVPYRWRPTAKPLSRRNWPAQAGWWWCRQASRSSRHRPRRASSC